MFSLNVARTCRAVCRSNECRRGKVPARNGTRHAKCCPQLVHAYLPCVHRRARRRVQSRARRGSGCTSRHPQDDQRHQPHETTPCIRTPATTRCGEYHWDQYRQRHLCHWPAESACLWLHPVWASTAIRHIYRYHHGRGYILERARVALRCKTVAVRKLILNAFIFGSCILRS